VQACNFLVRVALVLTTLMKVLFLHLKVIKKLIASSKKYSPTTRDLDTTNVTEPGAANPNGRRPAPPCFAQPQINHLKSIS
jgi:hypothetical protein